jgi:predicted nuclease of predicted toxin-antitoxin system
MRFLVDECTGPGVARWLQDHSHEVFSVYDQARGLTDDEILLKAHSENWIVITNDKDFGEQVYRARQPHRGVVLLRLKDERADAKIAAIERLLDAYVDRLPDAFVVVTETQVRFGQA